MQLNKKKRRAILGISGATGIIYALKLAKILLEANADVYCIYTSVAEKILADETPFSDFQSAFKSELSSDPGLADSLRFCDNGDFRQPPASGSFNFEAMAILPCSMKTMGKIAHSIADNLLVRAADVALKERRKFVICPRETPLAYTHIENMRILSLAGAVVMPPCPAFYHKPRSIDELAEFTACRIAASMGFGQGNLKEWGL